MTENERRLGLALDKTLRELADAQRLIAELRDLLREIKGAQLFVDACDVVSKARLDADLDDEIPF